KLVGRHAALAPTAQPLDELLAATTASLPEDELVATRLELDLAARMQSQRRPMFDWNGYLAFLTDAHDGILPVGILHREAAKALRELRLLCISGERVRPREPPALTPNVCSCRTYVPMIACVLIPGFELRAALRSQPSVVLRAA